MQPINSNEWSRARQDGQRRWVLAAMRLRHRCVLLLLPMVLALSPLPAHAVTDEIQVYNAEIAEVGQWTLQQHLNYAISGRKWPDFPAGTTGGHSQEPGCAR